MDSCTGFQSATPFCIRADLGFFKKNFVRKYVFVLLNTTRARKYMAVDDEGEEAMVKKERKETGRTRKGK